MRPEVRAKVKSPEVAAILIPVIPTAPSPIVLSIMTSFKPVILTDLPLILLVPKV